MKPFVPQHGFLINPTNKTCLISIITQCFASDTVSRPNDRHIVSTASGVSNPVLVVSTDTEFLAIPVNQAIGIHGFVYMRRDLTSCVNVLDIQEKIGTVKTHLLFVHAVSGFDSVSARFGKGKKTDMMI